jgi:hypothetical protein
MALCLVFIRRLFHSFHISFFFRISNFFDLRITKETWAVEMHIWCIKIGNVLVLNTDILREEEDVMKDMGHWGSTLTQLRKGDIFIVPQLLWQKIIVFFLCFLIQ